MPYVVKYCGEYLVRSANAVTSSRRRRFTKHLNEATVWVQPGHAKNAIREVFNQQPTLVSAKATFEVILVNYVEGPVAAKVRRAKDRYGHPTMKDVV